MSELKRCPFCGGDGLLHQATTVSPDAHYVECRICEAGTKYHTQNYAVEVWNRRTTPPLPVDVAGLLADVAINLEGVAEGPWFWSHSYELDGMHWCLHNPEGDAEGKTIEAALVLKTTSDEWFNKPIPELPNVRFVAWARTAVDRLAATLESLSRERAGTVFVDKWDHGCAALCANIDLWVARCPHCGVRSADRQ